MTPMEQQYWELKKEAGENLLFFRLGDFYEMFGEDAEIASEILEIALTSRNKKSENPLPMCGIPVRAAERYIAKLTRAGKKVAIAEQVSDPSEKGIVERKIVNIITPGTTLSELVLESDKVHYLCSLYIPSANDIAVAFCDVSTGEAFVQCFQNLDDAVKEIMKREVAEVLMTPDHFREYSKSFGYFSGALSRHFLPEDSHKFLLNFFGVKTLKSFGIETFESAIHASALLFSFVEDNQKQDSPHFSGISLKENNTRLKLDADTIKNLELFAGSDGNTKNGLFAHLNNTKTAMGARELQRIMLEPFIDKKEIESRLLAEEELIHDTTLHDHITKALSHISDIERILSRIASGKLLPSDFVKLQQSIQATEDISKILQESESEQWQKMGKTLDEILTTKQ